MLVCHFLTPVHLLKCTKLLYYTTDLPYKSTAESERQHKGRCILLTYETGHLARRETFSLWGPCFGLITPLSMMVHDN
jgi:hypothetical protein